MKEKFTLTEFNIVYVLDEIRKPNGNKKSNTKTFEDIVPAVWKKLGLGKNPYPIALEKLLINLILNIYDVEKAESIKEKRETSKNRDISLLMFGLLDGYYHTKEKDGKKINVPSEERNESYLNNSDFIKLDYPGEGTYQEIKIKDKKRKTKSDSAQPRPLNKLTKIAGECKKEIGINLFELIKNESYKDYMGKLQDMDNASDSIDLPKPCYTSYSFQPEASESGSDPTENLSGESSIAQGDNRNTEGLQTDPILTGYDEGEKDWGKQIAEELAKVTKKLYCTNIIFAVLVVALILFFIIYFRQTKEPSMDDTIPVANSILSSAEASSDNSLLVEMETFSIDENDKVIPLAPGYSRGLPIKNPEPSNADMSTLKVESSDESIVLWDKERLSLTALDNIPEGGTHKVYVTITAKNHREIICIEVKEFVISDDAEGLVGGGE